MFHLEVDPKTQYEYLYPSAHAFSSPLKIKSEAEGKKTAEKHTFKKCTVCVSCSLIALLN
jgi:hypothetical protein